MRRGLGCVLAAAVLLVGACGDDDGEDAGASDTTTTTAAAATTTSEGGSSGGDPVTGPADITAGDQSGDGTTVEVASVTLPTPGFIAVHSDNGGAPGPVIGHSDLLPEGESTGVVVTLDEPLTATATVHPMAHVDANDNGEYDFDPPAVTDDVPATFEDGETAMVPVAYTVDSGAQSGEGEAAAGGSAVTAEDFSFQPATIEVTAGSAITWTNNDSAPHTVTAGTPEAQTGDFHESLDPGGTAEITFDEAGTFAYYCSVHPGMRGEVVVS
jgi:plastocyanin